MVTKTVALEQLDIAPGVQLAARGVDGATVQGYVEALASGAQFPPVLAFSENGNLWLADGFHRVAALKFLGHETVEAEIKDGTKCDAMIYAATANVEHGKPMSQAEKREAGKRLLRLTNWSNREIARRLAVSEKAVRNWRALSADMSADTSLTRTVMRSGTTYTMDVSAIAKRPTQAEWKPPDAPVPHVSYNSGNNEWYTPPEYIAAARAVMGGIDLDPASCEVANEIVGAKTFYTAEDDGLAHDWQGRVWMNPPYSSDLIGRFADKLVRHVRQGDVTEACVLVNNATETRWFGVLLEVASCVCFIRGRVRFLDAQGNPTGAPLQGQAVLYMGKNGRSFARAFSGFGTILYAWRD